MIDKKHFLTFDIEHSYEGILHRGWSIKNLDSAKDLDSIDRILELLDSLNITATFFVTGKFAKENPYIIRNIVSGGNEVASHSNEHIVIDRLGGIEKFTEDLRISIDILSGITGKSVLGYRAPKWSVNPKNEKQVFEVMADQGLVYDSSFFPRFRYPGRYQDGVPLLINLSNDRTLIEVPYSGCNIGPFSIPLTGGFYFRLSPYFLINLALRSKNVLNKSGMIYLHPYDFYDSAQCTTEASILYRASRAYGVNESLLKLKKIITSMRFSSIENQLKQLRGNLVLPGYGYE